MFKRVRQTSAAVALAGAAATTATTSPAWASTEWGLNGTYSATSNGEWSKTNDQFRDETSLRGTWSISTQCSYPTECTGTVASDFGWTAPIYKTGGVWYVKHVVENWQPCPDGTATPGLQVYRFAPTTPDGSRTDPTSTMLVGEDQTTGQAGACGISKPLVVNMPFKLIKM